ncbi:hypothetical protein LEP1GSC043_3733 [Leptospira weilii str. Ecochallenge]|uniref:Uncharacterized protein n=3 Tax=Leptospira weilii TaxID=28184 RepID=N1U7Y5_9LEPT|nr:hypothetical protein LEP1GSC038_0824 [Leptospira weilii str. 2006001855]EMN44740.1 hypothetical protein LEP1GSC086_4165 [Leptospira weilii str. LNT 1234]EMN90847.1 hypothetical protein LEP1GSC108_2234 [Leptospira weilii str. UI 13098]EMY14049.1 hypothetical protein LEP1GSC043_3733 [Leptospira weilii str. Ecochallenge]
MSNLQNFREILKHKAYPRHIQRYIFEAAVHPSYDEIN